ncbi:hypothetical protein [Amycolatopsis sp. NPDC051716]|uniref:hypothetical protein n=1 Tax=Amycolatopsis sp. NPDC051716 TaxID=3155804 RepID=UPI003430F8E6
METEPGHDEVQNHHHPARRSIMRLAVSDWGATARLVVLMAVGVLLVALAIGLLQVDVVVGPVQITHHTW